MADSAFVLADIDKLVQFEKKSEEAIKEFDADCNKKTEGG